MSLFKSMIITLGIFVVIGLFLLVVSFFQHQKKAEEELATIKDLYNKCEYAQVLSKINTNNYLQNNEDILFIKFESLMASGDFYEAETVIKKLIKMDSSNDQYHYYASVLYFNMGEFPNAIKEGEKAVSLNTKNIDYKLSLARLFSYDHKDKAIKIYKEIMQQDSRYEIAWAELSNIYEYNNDKNNLLKCREEAARKFPDNSYDQYMLGLVYEKSGRKNEALEFYKKALNLDPYSEIDAQERIEKITGKSYSMAQFKKERIPLDKMGNLLIAEVKINGAIGRFLVDTGASSTLIYKNFIKKNHLKLKTDTVGVFQMANGQKDFAPATYVDVKIGHHIFHDMRAYLSSGRGESGFDGLIGMDTLENFHFQVDSENRELILER